MKQAMMAVATVVFSVIAIHAADWPQWQGPDRTNLSKETGLMKEWPSSGPPVIWSASGIGGGYGSMAIVGERVYLQGMRNGSSIVSALLGGMLVSCVQVAA